jgi:hypothetical protein
MENGYLGVELVLSWKTTVNAIRRGAILSDTTTRMVYTASGNSTGSQGQRTAKRILTDVWHGKLREIFTEYRGSKE